MKEKKMIRLGRKLIRSMIVIFLVIMFSTSATILIAFFEEKLAEDRKLLTEVSETLHYCLAKPVDAENDFFTIDELLTGTHESMDYSSFIDNWLRNGADDHYYEAEDRLMLDREINGLSDIFVYRAGRGANGVLLNNFTVIFDLPDENGFCYPLGYEIGASKAFDTLKKVYETGVTEVVDGNALNSDSSVLVAFSPVMDLEGKVCAIIGAEYDIRHIVWAVLGDNYFLLINTILNFLMIFIAIYIFLRRSIVKPIGLISKHVNKFVSDENALVYEPITEIKTKDEIEQIADDFNSLAKRTIEYTKNLEAKTTEEERLRVDLDVASQIRSVVSSENTYPAFPERTDFDLCASLKHTKYNKCSFCNYFFTDTNHLFIVIGESLGDSLASMIFSVLSLSYIKCFAKMGFDPYKIAVETNNQLCSIEKKDAGLTVGAVIADIDLKNGDLRYVNAGMPPMLIKKPGESFELAKADLPFSLGQMRGVSFEENSIRLYQGSTVLFTSFGITEMSGPSGDKYGFDRLIGTMNRITGNVSGLDTTIKELENDIESFRGDTPVSLDTAVLGFRYYG